MYVLQRELWVLLLWSWCRSQMAFAEACRALPSYAKAESHYTAAGRAALAWFRRNYVTAGISINTFMVPLRCWVHAMQWSHRGCWRHSQPSCKCIIILVLKWIFNYTICHLLWYYPRGLSASQLFKNSMCWYKALGNTSLWKLEVKNVPKWVSPPKNSWNIWE